MKHNIIYLLILIIILSIGACKKFKIEDDFETINTIEPCYYCWSILLKNQNEIYLIEHNEENNIYLLSDTSTADTLKIDSVIWSEGTKLTVEELGAPIINQAIMCTNQSGYYSVLIYVTSGDTSFMLFSGNIILNSGTSLDISIPNSFSPNSDGVNDLLYVNIQGCASSFLFQVYSMDGELLFETNDIQDGWDGSYKNKYMPSGTYKAYVRNGYYDDGALHVFKLEEYVTLIR